MTGTPLPVFVGSIPSGCTLGEGPVWDDRLQCLWWTDIQEYRLHVWDWETKVTRSFVCPERLGSFGLTSDPARLVCAFASGFALFEPAAGQVQWIARPEADYRGIRFNDGKVDRQGNFWAGSMVENVELAGADLGSLYRLAADGSFSRHVDGLSISNSIAWSASGDLLWLADSTQQQIWQYAVDSIDQKLGLRRDFVRTQGKSSPDGSDVDAEGCLWNAEWGGSSVVRYQADGSVSLRLPVPVTQPTCVAFGGPDLDHLFVTSAREGISDEVLSTEAEAGNTLIYRCAISGLPAPKFQAAGLQLHAVGHPALFE